ncbi:DUF1353 domain-containing protein [Chenggangzhangella methanolivorans]|uniref:DUF1353 domain-containing protein n=1 Tax=Chenggangzhangella methanolivorans TaxID=1437009 RepID=A0A9E6RC52_9HYPH|nr:DUF1353 domain-containing protein [Chenggangzhangella methanolivorans]QZO02108.1 DUF1353 domain-containing protein [Chenggangzhangella methanolivorans]
MTVRALGLTAIICTVWALPASAQFTGDLAFDPDGCMAERKCILRSPLLFIDGAKRTWRAEAGDVTDGASIPDWAQSIIGGPWDEAYLKAAVLHDHYCDRRTASWGDTHLMFYEALIELGVSVYKSKLMYYAVYVGGPRWIDMVAPTCGDGSGAPCADGQQPTMKRIGEIVRGERYDRLDMRAEMAEVSARMDADPDMSLEDLRSMAAKNHPEDPFLKQDGPVRAGEPADRFMRSMR